MNTKTPYIDVAHIRSEYRKKMHYGLPEQFHDLSPRRQRMLQEFIDQQLTECEATVNAYIEKKVMEFKDLAQQLDEEMERGRQDAALNAVIIGIKTLNELYGFGLKRISRLIFTWQKDIQDFYEDRDVREPQLRKWIEDIGYSFQDGKLIGYTDQENNVIHKRTYEKQETEEQD